MNKQEYTQAMQRYAAIERKEHLLILDDMGGSQVKEARLKRLPTAQFHSYENGEKAKLEGEKPYRLASDFGWEESDHKRAIRGNVWGQHPIYSVFYVLIMVVDAHTSVKTHRTRKAKFYCT